MSDFTKFDFEGKTIRILEDDPKIHLSGRQLKDPTPCIICEKVGPPNKVVPLQPGEVFLVGEPQPLGEFPAREDQPVVPDPNVEGWTCQCYSGAEVYPRPKLPFPDSKDEAGWKNYLSYLEAITNEHELEVGMEVVFQSLFGGLVLATVVKDEHGTFYAENDSSIYTLTFNTDDRHCWVSPGGINKRAIQRVKDAQP
jgi:hypothetical protein